MRKIFFLAACLLSTPVFAAPLDFNGWNAQTTFETAQGLRSCSPGVDICSLERTDVGGVPIGRSMVMFNHGSHRITSVVFWIDKLFMDRAVTVFTEKYGKPTKDETKQKVNKTGGPYESRVVVWSFENGNTAGLVQGENDVLVDLTWKENVAPVAKPKVDF